MTGDGGRRGEEEESGKMGADGTEIGGTGRLGRYRPRSGSEPIERLSRNSGGRGGVLCQVHGVK